MKKRTTALVLISILAISIATGIALYSASKNKPSQQWGAYTIIGSLAYAPGHAIYTGISATKITPNLSPSPTTRSFTDNGENDTVDSFVFLNFQPDLYYPANLTHFNSDFPTGFNEGSVVEVAGQMGYSMSSQAYVMNVTSIESIGGLTGLH